MQNPMTEAPGNRNSTARFCEHDGIFIRFSRAAGSTWRALASGALKPWWLKLSTHKQTKHALTEKMTRKMQETEVTDNA